MSNGYCRKGHALTPENTYRRGQQTPRCKVCWRAYHNAYVAAKRAAEPPGAYAAQARAYYWANRDQILARRRAYRQQREAS